jgi:hypothetical protein
MQVIHPVNDESLVSYHRPELLALLPGLELALDCWNLLDTNGRGSEKGKYLCKEVGEPRQAYKDRLDRSTYTPIYRDTIKAYAGLLSRFQMVGAPKSLEQAEQNVDGQGSSIYSFWNSCDELAIRDGGVYILTDMPPREEEENNYLDEKRIGRRPYLMQIERRDVINWSVEYIRGREYVRHVTVRQIRSRPAEKGYGVITEPVYLVLKPGSVETVRLEKKDGKWSNVSESIVPMSMPIIPISWYGASTSRFGQGDLPMNGLGELSIQHYQMRSDLQELLHKCAMPVPVRKGAPMGANGQRAPLIIGSNTAVDLDGNPGSDFFFAEPSGRSLERHQAEIEHVEALMDRSGLNFLYGANIKTATEASLRASQIASQVSSLIRNKTSSFNLVMRVWAYYSGELASLTAESGIAINDSLVNKPIDPSGIAQLINLVSNKMLSKRSALEEMMRGGVLDPDMKVDAELKRIKEEEAEAPPEPAQPQPDSSAPGTTTTRQRAAVPVPAR